MLTVFLTLTVAAAQVADLPLTRVTLLRDTGCWLLWEGEVSATQGSAAFRLSNDVELPTLSVEQFDKGEWRVADFTAQPQSPVAGNAKSEHGVSLRVSAPADAKSLKLRVQGFSTSNHWRPGYLLTIGDKSPNLTLRAFLSGGQPLGGDLAVECASASTLRRGNGEDRWSDPTLYPLAAKKLERGMTSLVVVSAPVRAEEFVQVELGGMAGEPGVRPSPDRALSMVRLQNKTGKPWPTGDLLVTKDGRLTARATFPHTDPGRLCEIALGTAVGISVAREEVELERKTLVVRRETDAPDSVQTAGSATIANGSGHAVDVRATKTVAGDATGASDDAKIVRVPNRLGAEQPLNEIRWSFTLATGQSKRLTFGTSIRIPQPPEPKDRP